MENQRTVVQRKRRYAPCRPIVTGVGIALGIALTQSAAHASTYRVYTDHANATMTLNASDGFCSLAEAVQHARGNAVYNCTDFDPSSGEQKIELLQAPNRPYSANHWTVTSPLTLTRPGVRIRIFGAGGAVIDSTTYSAFIVSSGSAAFFERVTLTNTNGSGGGRLIENYGDLSIYGVTITKGDVTGSQHQTGRGGGIFNGNTGVISFAENSTITANKARKGGGVYNDSGIIRELGVTISNNTATQAGGGIYNMSTSPPPDEASNGTIETSGLFLTGNSAPAGGGVFNRGLFKLSLSVVTGNFTTTGSSGESCTGSTSCNGSGGGILSAHLPNGAVPRTQLNDSTLANNTAIARGGAVYNVGVLELAGNAINGNKASDGAAIWVTGPTDGTQQYCNVYGSNFTAPATINNNCVTVNGNCANGTSNYSIVSGTANAGFFKCTFGGLPKSGQPTYMTATGNGTPYCKSGIFLIDSGSGSRCPQP